MVETQGRYYESFRDVVVHLNKDTRDALDRTETDRGEDIRDDLFLLLTIRNAGTLVDLFSFDQDQLFRARHVCDMMTNLFWSSVKDTEHVDSHHSLEKNNQAVC